jgi:hypothetical protein
VVEWNPKKRLDRRENHRRVGRFVYRGWSGQVGRSCSPDNPPQGRSNRYM